jgi:predicted DNA-binding transcriptional regulator YafY
MRADRLLKLVMLINRYGKMSAHTLAERLEVSRRTIYRDVNALTTAGIPVHTEGGPGGGIWLDKHYQAALTSFNEDELKTLFVSGEASVWADLGLSRAAESSLLKLFAALPNQRRQQIEAYQERIYLDPTLWWNNQPPAPNVISLIQKAVFDEQSLILTYERNDGNIHDRLVQPYGLVAKGGSWYLVADESGNFRSYRVSRITDVKLTNRHFQRHPDFDLIAHWHKQTEQFLQSVERYSFTLQVKVSRLEFLRLYVSGHIEVDHSRSEGDWHRVDFTVGSIDAALMIVLGLGKDCIIVAPESLKERIVSCLELLSDHYGT